MSDQFLDKRRRPGFWTTDNVVFERFYPYIKMMGFTVYSYLCYRANLDSEAWPKVRTIMSGIELGETSVRDTLRLLRTAGMIHYEPIYKPGTQQITGNRYTILDIENKYPPGYQEPVILPATPVGGGGGVSPGREGVYRPGERGVYRPGDTQRNKTHIEQDSVNIPPITSPKGEEKASDGIAYWIDRYRLKHKRNPTLSKKDIGQLARFYKAMKPDGFKKAVDGYFISNDAFVMKNRYDTATFLISPDRYIRDQVTLFANAGIQFDAEDDPQGPTPFSI